MIPSQGVGWAGIGPTRTEFSCFDRLPFQRGLLSHDVQLRWTRAGAQTGRVDILQSPDFLNAEPFNHLFPEAMARIEDYWRLVEYPELLRIYQEHVHDAVIGAESPEVALRNAAQEMQQILDTRR